MVKSVQRGACILVAGVIIGALLVGHEALFKSLQDLLAMDNGILGRVRRSAHGNASSEAGTAIYTIWGRTHCPNGASLVYKGIVGSGGTNNDATFGGSEYVCLIEEPKYGRTVPGYNDVSGMHGAEFQAGDRLFNLDNVIGDTLVNQNAVCAVCRTTKSVQVMVPGTNTCMPGWHTEYYGYLMSSKWNSGSQRNFICVDIAPEADRSGADAEGGAELWPVEGGCNWALPCPKYEAGKELMCVVCSN